jgi:hypothetical protein
VHILTRRRARDGRRGTAAWLRRLACSATVTGVAAVAGVVLTAAPASAHGLGGIAPTNYQSRLLRVEPAVPGITLRVVDLGAKLELTNRTDHDVVVLGYDNEPYLRIGPAGVFENTRSPATTLNRSTTITQAPPKSADPSAPPKWRRVSDGPTAGWHDHRAHFMGGDTPPQVQRAPDRRHVLFTWTVPIRDGTRTINATGDVAWVAPPSPWPYVAAALLLAVAVVVVSRQGARSRVVGAVLAVLVAVEVLHVVGAWGASSANAGTKLVQSAYSLGGIALGVVALVWMARRGAHAAAPLVLVAAIVLVVAGGLADITTLGRSQVPTTFSAGTARILVALTLGLGLGVVAAAALRLRPDPSGRARPRPRQQAEATLTS